MPVRKSAIIPVFLALVLTLTLLVSVTAWQVTAQGDATPTPVIEDWYVQESADWDLPYLQPGTSSGDAEWLVESALFESDYPGGFTFSVEANSSKGEIVLASVIWSHTPHQLKRGELESYNYRNGRFMYHWIPNDSLPPWIAVNYYWSFADSAGNRYRTDWILGNEYNPNYEGWTRAESEDVIVFLQAGLSSDVIDLAFEAMETQRETYLQSWGTLLPYKPRAILFSNQRDFQEWRSGFGGSSVIGQTSAEWGATAQVISGDDPYDLAFGTVLHEVAHLYQLEFAPNAFPAGSWFTEGNATFFELHQQYDYEERIREIAADGELPLLLQGSGPSPFTEGPDDHGRYGYDVGYTFFKWMAINYGLDAHRRLIEEMAAGVPRNTALEIVLGLSIYEIETSWALWLGANAGAATLIPTQPYVFPPTVTPFIIPTRAS